MCSIFKIKIRQTDTRVKAFCDINEISISISSVKISRWRIQSYSKVFHLLTERWIFSGKYSFSGFIEQKHLCICLCVFSDLYTKIMKCVIDTYFKIFQLLAHIIWKNYIFYFTILYYTIFQVYLKNITRIKC